MMSEPENQFTSQASQPDKEKNSDCDVTASTELEKLSLEESTNVEVIRTLVTPKDAEETLDDDRSPKKTERPIPLEAIEQTLGGVEGTDKDVEVERKPMTPESLP